MDDRNTGVKGVCFLFIRTAAQGRNGRAHGRKMIRKWEEEHTNNKGAEKQRDIEKENVNGIVGLVLHPHKERLSASRATGAGRIAGVVTVIVTAGPAVVVAAGSAIRVPVATVTVVITIAVVTITITVTVTITVITAVAVAITTVATAVAAAVVTAVAMATAAAAAAVAVSMPASMRRTARMAAATARSAAVVTSAGATATRRVRAVGLLVTRLSTVEA